MKHVLHIKVRGTDVYSAVRRRDDSEFLSVIKITNNHDYNVGGGTVSIGYYDGCLGVRFDIAPDPGKKPGEEDMIKCCELAVGHHSFDLEFLVVPDMTDWSLWTHLGHAMMAAISSGDNRASLIRVVLDFIENHNDLIHDLIETAETIAK